MNIWMTRLGFVVLLSLVLGRSVSAQSTTSEIELISGTGPGSSVIIADNEPGVDLNPANGLLLYTNSDFNGWNISFVGGTTNSPSASPFALDISSFSATSTSSATSPLYVLYSDVNFDTPSALTTNFNVAMTGNGTASESAYLDTSNTVLATTLSTSTLIGQVGPFTNVAYGAGAAGIATAGVPYYSLTLEQILTDNSGAVSFTTDGSITPTPELSTVILFGTGLLLIGGVLRRTRELL